MSKGCLWALIIMCFLAAWLVYLAHILGVILRGA